MTALDARGAPSWVEPAGPPLGDILAVATLGALGATSITTQIVLLREFLSAFYGNELVIGMVLANWMVLTGLGSFFWKFSERQAGRASAVALALVGLALLPMITVTLLRLLRNVVFLPGGMIGIVQASTSSLVLLAPFCLLSGFAFALFAASLSHGRGGNQVAEAYSWESLGSAFGGAGFTLLLLPWLDTFQALALLLAFDLGLALLVARKSGQRLLPALVAALLLAAALLMGFTDLDTLTRRMLFPGQELLAFKDTPYGNLTVTRQGEQLNFFENNVLLSSTFDAPATEESVHYGMAQHPRPLGVLLIGGGISGAAREILKYDVQAVDYAEVNPWLIELGRTFSQGLGDRRVQVVLDDARRYVRRTTNRYDVALVNLSDPETAHLNRYFTIEFFRELKRVLRDGAILSISLLPAVEYQGPEAKVLTSSLYVTLKQQFANVLIVPGGRNYFLASDAPLDIHVGQLIVQRGVATVFVNQYYLDDRMLEARSQELTAALDRAAAINTDFSPVCYFQQLAYWLSSLGSSPGPWVLLSLVALLMVAWKLSAISIGIFAGGFCASSLEIILLIAFQALYGSLYQMTGLVVTAFMAGLAVGAWAIRCFAGQAHMLSFITLQLVVAGAGLVLPQILSRLQGADLAPTVVHLLFTTMAFGVATLIGMEFAMAARLRSGGAAAIAGELYGLDLAGSAVGALVVTVYAIPLLGMKNVSLLVAVVSTLAAVICFCSRGRYRLRVG